LYPTNAWSRSLRCCDETQSTRRRPCFHELSFSLSALIACTGEKEKDAGPLDDTQAEDVSIDFSLNFYDAFTDAALVGAEHCVLEPDLR
jgi:hypothetical protein